MLKDGRRTHALKNEDRPHRTLLIGALTAAFCMIGVVAAQAAPAKREAERNPFVVIWGDDIGAWNISAYTGRDGLSNAQYRPHRE